MKEYGTFHKSSVYAILHIAKEYVCAIQYNDYSNLDFNDEVAIESFLDTLPDDNLEWEWGTEEAYCRDDVTGTMTECVEATLIIA